MANSAYKRLIIQRLAAAVERQEKGESAAPLRNYTEKDIVSISDDRDRVRKSPTLYLPSIYADGCLHIIGEIADNSLDELSTKNTVGHSLFISYDKKTFECVVIDDGAGIPHGSLLKAYTVLATSGKMDNTETSAYTYSGGVFGHGAKLQTFLSKKSEVTSMREGKYLTYSFKDGKLQDTKTGKSKEHGLITKFTLDKKLVHIDELDPDDIREWLHQKSYCFPDIKITFVVLNGGKKVDEVTFEGNTLVDLAKRMGPDTELVHIEDTRKRDVVKTFGDEKATTVKLEMDIAFGYCEKALELDTDALLVSYVNTIHTYSGGTQVEGMKQGLIKFFKEVVIPKLPKKEQDLQITPGDITAGLCGVVSVRLSRPEFAGQHKERLTNQEVKFMVRDAVYDALVDLKSSVANQLISFVKRVARGRMASKKTRKKDVDNAFSKDRDIKYHPIQYSKKTVSPELYLVEGDSAAGLATSARDPYNQAIFGIKKPKNIFDMDSETLAQKAVSVFNEVCDKANITPGKRCDPSTCVFKHIWLMTDGDVDGDAICIAVFAQFWRHCRPIVDAGIIGRILPPAYAFREKVKGKKGDQKRFAHSKREFFEYVMGEFVKDVTISTGGKKALKGAALYDFLDTNFDYDKAVERLGDRYCCDYRVMEYIAWKYHGDAKDQTASYWKKAMAAYPSLAVLHEGKLVVIDGEIPGYDFINLAFDDTLDKHLKRFKAIQAMNDQITGYTVNGDKDKTLYDVMSLFRTYMPNHVQRIKGLGELSIKELKSLCMDPESRVGIIMKAQDLEDDISKISVIMSTKDAWQKARTALLQGVTLSSRDLDT